MVRGCDCVQVWGLRCGLGLRGEMAEVDVGPIRLAEGGLVQDVWFYF